MTPIVKNAHLWQRQARVVHIYDVAKSKRVLQCGYVGKVYVFSRIQ